MAKREVAEKVIVNYSEKRTATLGGLYISQVFSSLGNVHLTTREERQMILEDKHVEWLRANVLEAIIKTVRVTTTVEDIEE